MESWVSLLTVTRGGESVPVHMRMSSYEQCMVAGHEAEVIASKLKDVKLTWACRTEG